MQEAQEVNRARRHYARPSASTTGFAGPSAVPRWRPALWPSVAALLLIPLCIAAGNWQWQKAARKADAQRQYDAQRMLPAFPVPTTAVDGGTLRERTVIAHGYYEPARQILIDNRTYGGRAGYHLLTPLRLAGSNMRVLVNRGWLPAAADRQTPRVATPSGPVDVLGTVQLPPEHVFTLSEDSVASPLALAPDAAPALWQHLDLARYVEAAGVPLQPFVIQLDARSDAGGFVRDWIRADDGRYVNLGYALQWWAFAATLSVLWLYHGWRRPATSA